tara:strand:- start:208 stop:810 length:603 start_codon:yes stop_codon:yes gene_type:complete
MGRTNFILDAVYKDKFPIKGPIALLGFKDNRISSGDLYDLELGNWNINSDWKLPKKYNSIISTRCPYFAKNPKDFIKRCYDNLEDNGEIFLDWGLGDHWRFENYKVGWVKDGEHEFAYKNDNFLWSTIFDKSFLKNEHYLLFEERIKKFGYNNLKEAIYKEVPEVLEFDYIKKYFNVSYELLTVWEDLPQLYIFIRGQKK